MAAFPSLEGEGMSPDGRVARIAERQHGVITHAQALAQGLTDTQIAFRISSGAWERVHRGIYRLRGSAFTFEGRTLAAVFAAGEYSVASFTTGGKLWRLPDLEPTAIHVTVANRTHLSIPGLKVHRPRIWSPADRTSIGAIPVTTPSRTILDLASLVRAEVLGDAIDEFNRRALVNVASLLDRVSRMNPQGRRGVGVLRRLLAERVGVAPPGSRRERDLGHLLVRAGLPAPVPQYVVRTPSGAFVGCVDYAYPDEKVAIEFDGYEKHSSRRQWEGDRVRQNRLVALGWYPLRVTSEQIDRSEADVVATVWGVLSAHRPRNTPQTQPGPRSGAS
jgi:hypothetical protein